MPRSSREAHRALGRLPKAIAEGGLTAAAHRVVAQGKPVLPRLWNAKRRIKTGRILDPERTLKENGRRVPGNVALNVVLQDRDSQAWKRLVSEDVVKFIEDAKLPPEARNNCLANPTAFFAYPNNVPEALRKQVYFPQFSITLTRSSTLPPKYAAFGVPLWFNKLDMKDYLRSVYGVEVLHVRSTVSQASVRRRDTKSKFSNGQLHRPQSTKKMIVELVNPFVWPDVEEDLTPWDKDTYDAGNQFSIDENKKREESAPTEPNKHHRKSIAEQAKELIAGKTAWKPTWESMPTDSRILKPFDPKKLGVVMNARTAGRSVSAPR